MEVQCLISLAKHSLSKQRKDHKHIALGLTLNLSVYICAHTLTFFVIFNVFKSQCSCLGYLFFIQGLSNAISGGHLMTLSIWTRTILTGEWCFTNIILLGNDSKTAANLYDCNSSVQSLKDSLVCLGYTKIFLKENHTALT